MAATDLTLPSSPTPNSWRRRLFLAGVLVILVGLYLFQPIFSAWLLAHELTSYARARGYRLSHGLIEADLLAGKIHLLDTLLADERSPDRTIRAGVIDLHFSPFRALFSKSESPVKELHLEKVNARWALRKEADGEFTVVAGKNWDRWFPTTISGEGINGRLEWPGGAMEATGVEGVFREGTAGRLAIPRLALARAGQNRVFSNLSGTTSLKAHALYVGGIKFSDTLELDRGVLDFQDLSKARLTSGMEFSAFGGELRTDTQVDLRKSPALLDLTSEFWNLSVAQMGAFTGNTTLASGIIHDGRVTFRGHPADAARASITLRLNATDFQWRERQWQSLVVSALLVNKRLEIPQFSLLQDKNQIEIDGSMAMPEKWTSLPSQFQLNIRAQIDDLAQAASLLAPGQRAVSGEAFFAGKIGRKDGELSGQLNMRGGPLTISGVAIDRVRGDLALQGTEVNASNLILAHRDDLATGWMTFDFGGLRRYSGQFDLSASNIADYQAILPASVAGHAVAGGAKIWWSGDGTSEAHSGAFKISLKDFLLSRAPDTLPLNVETHGSYSPGGITLNRLHVARPETQAEAMVVVRPDSLEIRNLHGTGKSNSTLTGNLVLPLNILAALQTPSWKSLLDSASPTTGQLSAQSIQLGDFLEFSGRRWPVRGKASFDLTLAGLLETLTASGMLQLGDFFTSIQGTDYRIPAAEMKFNLAENHLKLDGKILPSPGSEVTGTLELGLKIKREALAKGEIIDSTAQWSGSLTGKEFPLEFLYPWIPQSRSFGGEMAGTLQLGGTPASPQWTGKLQVNEGSWLTDFLELPLKRITGNFELFPDHIQWMDLAGEYRGGKFSAKGGTGFSPEADLSLNLGISSLPLPDDDGWQALLDGNLVLTGPATARKLAGVATLEKAFVNRDLVTTPLPSPIGFTLPWVPAEWQLDLNVQTEGPLEIVGPLSHWKMMPHVKISGSASQPIFQGTIAASELTPSSLREGVLYLLSTTFEQGDFVLSEPESNELLATPSNAGEMATHLFWRYSDPNQN